MAFSHIDWSDEQLEAAGIDRRKLASIVRRFGKLADEIRELGLHVYGASGTGCLIHESRPTHKMGSLNEVADQGSVVATLGLGFDGGDW